MVKAVERAGDRVVGLEGSVIGDLGEAHAFEWGPLDADDGRGSVKIRPMVLPGGMIQRFAKVAEPNSRKVSEWCGKSLIVWEWEGRMGRLIVGRRCL